MPAEYDYLNGLEWIGAAACVSAGISIDAFFTPPGAGISHETLEVCRACPVRAECLAWAYLRGIAHGYFGGLSASQRSLISLAEALESIKQD